MTKRLIAKVAVPLPVDKTFDYYIPSRISKNVKVGIRVRVSFNKKPLIGFVVSICSKSSFPKLKPIQKTIDKGPVFSAATLCLAEKIRSYYFCSLGEILDFMLPHALKKTKGLNSVVTSSPSKIKSKSRWRFVRTSSLETFSYKIKDEIEEKIKQKKKIIIILPELRMIALVKSELEQFSGLNIGIWHGKLSKKSAIQLWSDLAESKIDILVGTRSSIFAPISNLGLIIIKDENAYAHKADQVPYYHSVIVARMRSEIENCNVLLSSLIPSINTFAMLQKHLVKSKKQDSIIPRAELITAGINFKDKIDVVLKSELSAALERDEKILIFLNRKGFATSIYCKKCQEALRCNRCSSNLRFDYSQNIFHCPVCSYKTEPVEICQKCNSTYVKYKGMGLEKLESNLKRVFPSKKIITFNEFERSSDGNSDFDILISTQKIVHYDYFKFDLTVVWDLDSLLNIGDYRSSENLFHLLSSLLVKTENRMIVCSSQNQEFYLLKYLTKLDYKNFYKEELKFRRQLNLPPYFHFCLVSIRSLKKEYSQNTSKRLFGLLKKDKNSKIELVPSQDQGKSRVRGKHYNYLTVKSDNPTLLMNYIKRNVARVKTSSVIITANIDPL